MRKIVQITTTLMRMRPDPELDVGPAAPKDLREKRHFRRLARKLTMFIALLFFYGSALLIDRDIPARSRAGQALSKELLQTSLAPSGVTFDTGINDVESFWDWFGNSFVAMVYSTTTSSGLPRTNSQLYTIATRSKIICGFHIIQQRYLAINSSSPEHKSDLCYSILTAGKNQICFSTNGYSTDPFGAVSGDSNASSEAELSTLGMFHHSVNSEGVGGFQTYFLRSSTRGAAELAKANLMRSYGWIDGQTRSVEIVMPMYNLHLKTCSVVRLTIEFDLTGGITTSSTIHVMNTQAYNLHVSDNLARFIYEILYAVLVGYFTVMEVWNIFTVAHGNLRKYAARFGLFETMSELTSITTNMIVVVSRWLIMTSPKRKLMRTVPSLDNYAPLMDLAEQDDLYVAINILNVLVLMIRVLKYFQVTDGGKRLLNSIVSAVPDIASFTPIYVAVMICYAFAGHLLFGLTFPEWSTYTKAFCRVLEMNFGLYGPGPVYDASSFLGFIYISSASVIFCIIMLNVFMAIIMSTWDAFTEKELEKTKIREKYREKMSFGELVGLIFLRESILDSLIASVLKMDEHDAVNKQVFDQNWRASDPTLIMPSWARARILRWYWNSDNTPHVGPTAGHALQKSGSTTAHAGASGPPPLGSSSSHSLLHSKNNNTSESVHQREMLMHSTARVTPTQQFDQQ